MRNEPEPYTRGEIFDIAQYINISRALIDILGKDADIEMRGKKIVSKLKQRNGNELNTSHFTQSIRETVGNKRKIPKVVVEEIINDLENGEKSNWAWAIGVLLVSGNEDIKKCLKKVLLDERRFSSKAVLSLLNVTKITKLDTNYLFNIVEEEKGNQFSITVQIQGKKPFTTSINYGKIEAKDAIGKVRNKTLEKIIKHFCGK